LSEIKDNVLVSKEKGKEKEKEYDSGKFKKRDDIEWRRREKLGLEIDFFSLPVDLFFNLDFVFFYCLSDSLHFFFFFHRVKWFHLGRIGTCLG